MSAGNHVAGDTNPDDFVIVDTSVDIEVLNREYRMHMDELVEIEIAYGCPYSDKALLKMDKEEVTKGIDTLHEAYEFYGYEIPELKTTY